MLEVGGNLGEVGRWAGGGHFQLGQGPLEVIESDIALQGERDGLGDHMDLLRASCNG